MQRELEKQQQAWLDQVKHEGEDVSDMMDAFLERYKSNPDYRQAVMGEDVGSRSTRAAPEGQSIPDEVY